MIWNLDRIGPEPDVLAREFPNAAWLRKCGELDLFYFADYSIWVHAFSIRLGNDPEAPCPVFVDVLDDPLLVAPSFEDFLRSLIETPLDMVGLPMISWDEVSHPLRNEQPPIGPGLGVRKVIGLEPEQGG